MSTREPVSWISHAVSHVGTVRKINEDACLNQPARGLWAVADGMGGHDAGDVASREVIDALEQVPGDGSLAALAERLESTLQQVNDKLIRLARESDKHTIGSTVAILAVRGRHALCVWAGDSRIYRWRKGRLEQITQDHAMVEDMVEAGLISRAEAENHPQANRITRAIGAMEELFVDMDIHELEPGDRFLVCSDGLYKDATAKDLARLLRGKGDTAKEAVDLALEHGARDNVTVVTINIEKG
ncbi:MAG TPA: protein phosphatase 2C domain-containing protein [Gammaproteobacteria bacterium]